MVIFNNTSADFVLISADVLLKIATILKELKIAQLRSKNKRINTLHTEVRFASFLSGGFTTMTVINPAEWKLAKRTSVVSLLSHLFIEFQFRLSEDI